MSARLRPRDTGPSRGVRQLVMDRDVDVDGWPTCQWCGRGIQFPDNYSLQHRRSRNMGGTRDPMINAPSNLVLVCGSATTGCHGHIESHPYEAGNLGFALPDALDAHLEPIDCYSHGRVWLDDLGGTLGSQP